MNLSLLKSSVIERFQVPGQTASGSASEGWFFLKGDEVQVKKLGLQAVIRGLQKNPEAFFLYSDHDFIDAQERVSFTMCQPAWSLEHLRSKNYIGSAFAVRADYTARVFGVSEGDVASALTAEVSKCGWHDLILRLTERLKENQICHLDEVLFHLPSDWRWNMPARMETSVLAVQAHLDRLGVTATAESQLGARELCRVRYHLPANPPLVSIIIPTKDQVELLRRCVESILEKSTYPNFEILVVDNASVHPEMVHYQEILRGEKKVRVLRYEKPFNFSAINNDAAREARGEIICLLNDDTEVISADWLETMVGHLIQPGVGVVGVKLLFPNGTVQHGGDAVGPRGAADHLHSGIRADEPGYADRAVVAQDLSAVTGACLMTHKDLYERLGGLDELNLPIAYNDVDYCLRVREGGHHVLWTPHALLTHHELSTRGKNRSLASWIQLWKEKRVFRKRWQIGKRYDPFYGKQFNQKKADFVVR